jgi:hypothetical protein
MATIGVEGQNAISRLFERSLAIDPRGTTLIDGVLVHDLEIGQLVQGVALYAEVKGANRAVNPGVTKEFLKKLRESVVK